MIRRSLVGIFLGSVVGGLVAAALVMGLKVTTFDGVGGALLAYIAAALAGAVTGLITGTPIWKPGAKVEGGLKALFGAPVAVLCLFGLRRWGAGWVVDLHAFGAGGPSPVGELPAAAIPLVAAVLGFLFELDNTQDPRQSPGPSPAVQAPAAKRGARVPIEALEEPGQEDEAEAPAGRTRR